MSIDKTKAKNKAKANNQQTESDPFAVLKLQSTKVAIWDTAQLAAQVDKRVRKVMAMCESGSENVRAAANEALKSYMDDQRALFVRTRQSPDRALTHAIVPYMAENEDRIRYRIVKRNEPLEVKIEDDGSANSVRASRSYSDRVGRVREECRGKYNDAGLLIMQSSASVDPSEVTPWGCACM